MAILTISRQYGSGGKEITQGTAKRLGYDVLDKNRIFTEMGTFGDKWQAWGQGFDERRPSLWERHDWSFMGFKALLKSILLDFAVKDNVILVGRGARVLMKNVPHAYNIRVTAPLTNRLDRIMAREGLDYDTARWLAERTDLERKRFVMALYERQWDEPAVFDAVIDTGTISIEDTVEAVCKELADREARKTQEAVDSLKLRAVGAKVEASLLTRPNLFVNTLEVSIEGDELLVRGVIHNKKQKKLVEEIAVEAAGSTKMSFRLHYRME